MCCTVDILKTGLHPESPFHSKLWHIASGKDVEEMWGHCLGVKLEQQVPHFLLLLLVWDSLSVAPAEGIVCLRQIHDVHVD